MRTRTTFIALLSIAAVLAIAISAADSKPAPAKSPAPAVAKATSKVVAAVSPTAADLPEANAGKLVRHVQRVAVATRPEPAPRATTTAASAPGAAATAPPAHLQAIAACESGGDPTAVDASGTYRGKYQFSVETWQGVGGSGDPAAASEAEQDKRAQMLYQRSGPGQWPECGQ